MSDELWSKFTSFMKNTAPEPFIEIHRLMPDSILFGSILLYFLTHNYAFGIFSIFICEIIGTHKLISWISTEAVGPAKLDTEKFLKCYSGYKSARYDYKKIFSRNSFPSYGMFSITSIGVYLALAMLEFSNTLNAMDQTTRDQNWSSRSIVAYSLILSVITVYMIVRWISCESIGELSIAIILAIVTGLLFFYINKAIFGEEAMNFLGLPYLVSKESQGAPIYICAAEK